MIPEVSVLDLGDFRLDGGAIFSVVPRSMWEKYHEVDEQNRIILGLNATLIRDNDRIILVDAGTEESSGMLIHRLREQGLEPKDVTDVVFTHLHSDHIGGAFPREGDTFHPWFPEADYHLSEQELSDALNPDERTRYFYRTDAASWMARTGRARTVTTSTQISDHVELMPTPGHTLGHLAVWVYGPERWLIPGDLIPTVQHLNVHYMTSFDENTRLNIQTKKEILHRAALHPTRVVFYHDRKHPVALVEKSGNRYRAASASSDG